MKVRIEIECDNAAFCDEETGEQTTESASYEVARILRRLGERIYEAGDLPVVRMPLIDLNGNAVGSVSVEE